MCFMYFFNLIFLECYECECFCLVRLCISSLTPKSKRLRYAYFSLVVVVVCFSERFMLTL